MKEIQCLDKLTAANSQTVKPGTGISTHVMYHDKPMTGNIEVEHAVRKDFLNVQPLQSGRHCLHMI